MKKMTLIGLTLLLASCNFPGHGQKLEPTFTPIPGNEATVGNAPLTQAGTQECAWKWNSQTMPELTAELQSALEAAGMHESVGTASVFGEDCIDSGTGKVRYFAAKQTEFMITLPVESLSDTNALGGLLEEALMVLELFPPDSTPGPMAGRVTIIFDAGGEQEAFFFNQDEGTTAVKDGFSGAVLLEVLGYQP